MKHLRTKLNCIDERNRAVAYEALPNKWRFDIQLIQFFFKECADISIVKSGVDSIF